jgi:hypothetical protein
VAEWIRVEFRGTLVGGERWASGLSYASLGNPQVASLAPELLAAIAARAEVAIKNAASTNLLTLLSVAGAVTDVRVENRSDAAGLTSVVERPLSPQAAGVGAATKPHQVSCCISTLTGIPGRSRRGRAFWPAMGGQILSPAATVSVPSPLQIGEHFRALVAAIEDRAGTVPLQAVVHSSALGLNTPITEFRVGNYLDVQNGRRDALAELYTSVPNPAP